MIDKTPLFKEMDNLLKKWVLLENLLEPKFTLKDSSCSLSFSKTEGGKVRLCYKDRPLNECTITDKLEAVRDVSKFLQIVEESNSNLYNEALKANDVLHEAIQKVRNTLQKKGKA